MSGPVPSAVRALPPKAGGRTPSIQALVADGHNRGLSAREIADEIGISVRSIETYRSVLANAGRITPHDFGFAIRVAEWARARPIIIAKHEILSRKEIAILAGCTLRTVEALRAVLYAEGVLKPLRVKTNPLTEHQLGVAENAIRAGQTLVNIAKLAGIGVSTVSAIKAAMPSLTPRADRLKIAVVPYIAPPMAPINIPLPRVRSLFETNMRESLISRGNSPEKADLEVRRQLASNASKRRLV